jgi:DNA-binding Xre family transcriptional regulator
VSGKKTVSYRWHLRRLMAEAGMFATTDMGPRLSARGIDLSREQVYRLVTGVPERLSLPVLAALCDILDCGPGDLIEPVRKPARKEELAAEPALPSSPISGPAGRPPPTRRSTGTRGPAPPGFSGRSSPPAAS